MDAKTIKLKDNEGSPFVVRDKNGKHLSNIILYSDSERPGWFSIDIFRFEDSEANIIKVKHISNKGEIVYEKNINTNLVQVEIVEK